MINNDFLVIKKSIVEDIIKNKMSMVFDLVGKAYLLHGDNQSHNPPSYFLRFPHKSNSRIIALPSYLGEGFNVAGIKWISSFPDNIKKGFQRASAVFILNDAETGYPLACMESSYISAIRTAVSAVLAGELLHKNDIKARKLAIIGTGFIAKTILDIFVERNWDFSEIYLFDKNEQDAIRFKNDESNAGQNIIVETDINNALTKADTVVFATTALEPYLNDPKVFSHSPVVLHVSLRDLSPEVILNGTNFVDDIEHVLNANTSVDLASQKVGNHDFINGTIIDLIKGNTDIGVNKPLIFSPMGMGILDLALASFIYDKARDEGIGISIEDFFGDISR